MKKADDIIQLLKKGNERFFSGKPSKRTFNAQTLSKKQDPHTIILSCSDSRIVPEMIFDTGMGELFVVRIVGNIASSDALGSIEYAVAHCNAKCIIILGHEGCGSIASVMEKEHEAEGYLNHLFPHVSKAIKEVGESSDLNTVSKKSVQNSSHLLVQNSSIIRDAIVMNKIKIHSAYFHLKTGKVAFLDPS